MSHTSEAVEIFVELCMLVMDKFKSAILPFILDSDSINGSSNSNNDKVEISSAPARSMHDLLLIRLELLRDFEEHFDSLYEACKPDFRHESQASLALLQLKKAVIYACVKGLDAVSSAAADPGPVLSPELKSKNKESGTSEATELFNMSNAGRNAIYFSSARRLYAHVDNASDLDPLSAR